MSIFQFQGVATGGETATAVDEQVQVPSANKALNQVFETGKSFMQILSKSSLPSGPFLKIELGTTKTIYSYEDYPPMEEQTIVLVDDQEEVLKTGSEAFPLWEKTPRNQRTIHPMQHGFVRESELLRHFLKKSVDKYKAKHRIRFPLSGPTVLVGIPAKPSRDEFNFLLSTVGEAFGIKRKHPFIGDQALLAGIGAHAPVDTPDGAAVIDFGGGTIDLNIICDLGHTERGQQHIKIAGMVLTESIQGYLRRKPTKLLIGMPTAERLKIQLGSAIKPTGESTKSVKVWGDPVDDGPESAVITETMVWEAMNPKLIEIMDGLKGMRRNIPKEQKEFIRTNGVYLTGGGALLKGLSERILQDVELVATVADNPRYCVHEGMSIVSKDARLFSKVMHDTYVRSAY